MDLSKLTKGDKVVFGTGLLFLIAMFLPWFSYGYSGVDLNVNRNGFDVGSLWGTIPLLVVLAVCAWIAVKRFTTASLPADIPPMYLAGGAAVLLLPALKFLIGEDDGGLIDIDRSIGLVLAVLAGAGFAFGSLLKFAEGGGKLTDLAQQASSLVDQAKQPNDPNGPQS
jgi:amino acid transporter